MITCPKHPKYQGIREPSIECIECWRVYFSNERRIDEKQFQAAVEAMPEILKNAGIE